MNGPLSFAAPWTTFIESPHVLRIGSTLLHFLWQGAIAAVVALVLLRLLRQSKPQWRYVALLAIFCLTATSPIATFLALEPEAALKSSANQTPVIVAFDRSLVEPDPQELLTATSAARAEAPPTQQQLILDMPVVSVDAAPAAASLEPVADGPEIRRAVVTTRSVGDWLRTHRPWLVGLWFLGVCAFSVRLIIGFIGLERARRKGITPAAEFLQQSVQRLSERLGISRHIRVLESTLAEVPTLVGWLKPVILLPASAATGLTASQLEAILAHELAHVSRHDALVNLIQTVVETLLFYHPAVWWLSDRIRQEREHCCDDVAVAVCGDRVAFARALTAMEELRAAPRWAVTARGGSLMERVRHVIGKPQTCGSSQWPLVALVSFLAIVGGLLVHSHSETRAEEVVQGSTALSSDVKVADVVGLSLPPGPISMSAVAARVNGEPIFVKDVLIDCRKELEQVAATLPPDEVRKRQEQLLRERLPMLIELELLISATKSTLTAEEWQSLEQQLTQHSALLTRKSQNGLMLEMDLHAESEELGVPVAELYKLLGRQVISVHSLNSRIGDIEVTPEEVRAAYRDRAAEFLEPVQVEWQQLQVSFSREDDRVAARKVAEDALRLVQQGRSFDVVAAQRADIVYTVHGGEGRRMRLASVEESLRTPLEQLELGVASGIVESPDSFRIVKVVNRQAAQLPPFEEIEGLIRSQLTDEKREARQQQIVSDLRRQFPVETIFGESTAAEIKIVQQPAVSTMPTAAQEKQPAEAPVSTKIPKGTSKVVCRIRVLDSKGNPVAGASVTSTAYGASNGSSLGLTEEWFPSTTTDTEGRATITCMNIELLSQVTGNNLFGTLVQMISGGPEAPEDVYLQVDHPEAPRWSNRVTVQAAESTITLAPSSTIEIRARRAEDGQPLARLVPTFGSPGNTKPEWSEQDGVLTIRRLDLTSNQSPRWMTVVHVPETGPAMFGDPVDLKRHTGEKVSLVVAMRDGVRVEGRLDAQIPRPVKQGRVVGSSTFGIGEKGTWSWSAAADVKEDGTFVFESVPPDIPLQVMAFCDGWISQSTTLEELQEFKATTGFWASERGLEESGMVLPRLYYVSDRTVDLEMPMEPTADCSVAVIDAEERPIAGAMVSFIANIRWFNGGSTVIGEGRDALAWYRTRLATGQEPEFTAKTESDRFSGVTDAHGTVTIRNLPGRSNLLYVVGHRDYVAQEATPEFALAGFGQGLQKVALKPGKSATAIVPMVKGGTSLMTSRPDQQAVE